MSKHSTIGSMLGGSLSVYGMYRRKLWPVSKFLGRFLFFGVGGVVVGMQLGLVTASLTCVNIIRRLPHPENVMRALREVQVELQDARRRPTGAPREWSQKGEDDPSATAFSTTPQASERDPSNYANDSLTFGQMNDAQNMDSKQLDPNNMNYPTPFDESNIATTQPTTQFSGQKAGTDVNSSERSNVWQQIRGTAGNRPETAWDRLRRPAEAPKDKRSDGTPFGTDAESRDQEHNDYPLRESSEDVARNAALARKQQEFDALLDRERSGEAETARKSKNPYGDEV